jgi:hypothetical protein
VKNPRLGDSGDDLPVTRWSDPRIFVHLAS